MPASPPPTDVVILTALRLEYEAVLAVEDGAVPNEQWEHDRGPSNLPLAYRRFQTPSGRPLQVALALAPDMGATAAANTLLPLATQLKPRCVAICGVCAGRPGKTALGDVVAAERLYYTDTGKRHASKTDADISTYKLRDDWKATMESMGDTARTRFASASWFRERPYPTEWRHLRALVALRDKDPTPWTFADPTLRHGQWKTVIEALRKSKFLDKSNLLTTKGRTHLERVLFDHMNSLPDLSPTGAFLPFQLHVAPIGTGPQVVEDESIWAFLSATMRKTLGLEMEAAAVAEVAHRQRQLGLDFVAMKGVMDFANHGRDDHFKAFAARASAECLLWFLRDNLTRERPGEGQSPLTAGTSSLARQSKSPARLLSAHHAQVPWHATGRAKDMSALDAWARNRAPGVSLFLVHADGGTGKTRLAIEWTRQQRERFDVAGFLPAHPNGDWLQAVTAAQCRATVVIDYAEIRTDLTSILHQAVAFANANRKSIGFLLLARTNGTWWTDLCKHSAGLGEQFSSIETLQLPPLANDDIHRQQVFAEAASAFALILGRPTPLAAPPLTDRCFERALYIHMAALAATLDIPFTSGSLLEAILDHEERLWIPTDTPAATARQAREACLHILCSATLRGGLSRRDARMTLQRHLERALTPNDDTTLQQLHDTYRTDSALGYIPPLEPDLLGEALVVRAAQLASTSPSETREWLREAMGAELGTEVRTRALTVLTRCAALAPRVSRALLDTLLETDLKEYAEVALRVEKATSKAGLDSELAPALADALEARGDVAIAKSLENGIPYPSLSLHRVSRWVASTLLPVYETQASAVLPKIRVRDELARSFDAAGDYASAIAIDKVAIQEARNACTIRIPGARIALAQCLGNTAAHLAHAQRNKEALEFSREAVELARQEYALTRSSEARELLASALMGQSNASSETGSKSLGHELALEALGHFEALELENPGRHLGHLATTKSNIGNRHSDQKDHEGALRWLRAAAEDFEVLAAEDPDQHIPEYARTLTNVTAQHFLLRQRSEALAVARLAESLHRRAFRHAPRNAAMELAHLLQRKSLALIAESPTTADTEEAISNLSEAVDLLTGSNAPVLATRGLSILVAAADMLIRLLVQKGATAQRLAIMRTVADATRILQPEFAAPRSPFFANLLAQFKLDIRSGIATRDMDGGRISTLEALIHNLNSAPQ